jgi:branched-chain amino acid transport system ATP-binding protein/branched-chain amino acid transport system permease protein
MTTGALRVQGAVRNLGAHPMLSVTGVALVAVLIPLWVSSGYWLTVLTTLFVNIILVAGLNCMIGYAGLLNLGYAALAGLGAYTTTILMKDVSLNFWLALAAGVAVAVVVALGLALPTLRLSIVYLAIVTLAFGSIFSLLVFNLQDLTGGAAGIGAIPRPTLLGIEFTSTTNFYWLVLGILVVLALISVRLERSALGRAFRYIREDEIAAEASGIDSVQTKLCAWGIGAAFAAIGGTLTAVQFQAIGPDTYDVGLTFLILTMLVVGGTGSFAGAVVGATLFTLLPEFSRSLDEYRLLLYGVVLTAVMLIRPEGVWPARWHAEALELETTAAATPRSVSLVTREGVDKDSPLIEAHEVSKRFEGLIAVNRVSLAVFPAEIVSVIGPNGAGKTTLIDMMCGLSRPSGGKLLFCGRQVGRSRASWRARRGLGRTFQQIRLFPELTILENVLAGSHSLLRGSWIAGVLRTPAYTRAEAEAVARARQALDAVGGGLINRSDELAKHLPYGLQKRVELARALATDPLLLVLDEPASGLNSAEKHSMMELIVAIRNAGTGVVLIEHDMGLVMGISDRVIVLDNGELLVQGLPAEVQSDERVIDAYLGREVVLA